MTEIPLVDERIMMLLIDKPTTAQHQLDLGAACAPTTGSQYLLGDQAPDAEALALCAGCPVRQECLAMALYYEARDEIRDEDRFGWWGGFSPGERVLIARRIGIARPVVEFEDARPVVELEDIADRALRLRAEGRTVSSIASELGCAERTIYRYNRRCSGLEKESITMPRSIDEDLLPRPTQPIAAPAFAQATRRAAERLREQFGMSPDAAEAFAAAVVDPAEVRKAAEKPEQLYVPGGMLLALRTRVWTRRVMPDPRNPRVGPARCHPVAIAPGSVEEARYRPIPEPYPDPDGHPELALKIEGREQLTWSSVIAKKYILKDNDWRRSIRNQGVMTEVWLSAVSLVHGDGTASVTVPVTSEGSSRLVACHDILDVRSSDVPYSRDDRALRARVRSLNESVKNAARSKKQRDYAARRCRLFCLLAMSLTRDQNRRLQRPFVLLSPCATWSLPKRGMKPPRWARSRTACSKR